MELEIGERWSLAIGGGVLLLFARKRPEWAGAACAAIGAELIARGLRGSQRSVRTEADGSRVLLLKERLLDGPDADRAHETLARNPHLSSLARFVRRVEVIDDRHARLSAQAPFGASVDAMAEVDPSGRLAIAWRSGAGSTVVTRGAARLMLEVEGSSSDAELRSQPITGAMGLAMAKVLDDLARRLAPALAEWEPLRRAIFAPPARASSQLDALHEAR